MIDVDVIDGGARGAQELSAASLTKKCGSNVHFSRVQMALNPDKAARFRVVDEAREWSGVGSKDWNAAHSAG